MAAPGVGGGTGSRPAAAARFVLRIAAGDGNRLSGRHLEVYDDLDALLERADEISQQDLYMLRRQESPQH